MNIDLCAGENEACALATCEDVTPTTESCARVSIRKSAAPCVALSGIGVQFR
jgi:hypothetical protein